ncbi:MAG: YcgN family cysteine cluster protein [Alphaproteobacteria bacterium]|nr:YcgN family cysteine cluster protein [Alphaproteobacteria bacterium]
MTDPAPFWEIKSLAEMSREEWESLCDGCGRCCLVVLIDDASEDIYETDVCCRLFDPAKRRCKDYAARHARVPDCVRLTPQNAGAFDWMPQTCAYRRLARGEKLPAWHPLITGDRESVAKAGVAVDPFLDSEDDVPAVQIEARITKKR